MPDQSLPSSTPKAPASPDELNLTEPALDKPRLKRRSLKGRSSSPETLRPADVSSTTESEPLPDSPRPDYTRPQVSRIEPAAKPVQAIPAAKPSAGNPYTSVSSTSPTSAQSLPTTPLYYTTGVRREKEDASSMKTSTTSPAGSTPVGASSNTSFQNRSAAASPTRPVSTAASTAARPSTTASSGSARPASTPLSSSPTSSFASTPTVASPSRTTSTSDYRANVDRQSREQKSVGSMISMVVYALAGLFVLGALLAVYGTYTISRQMHEQSVTLSDLDSRYTAENQALSAQLKATNDSLTQALTQTQTQLARQQELLNRQQDSVNKLTLSSDANTAALRQERQARTQETATLRTRVRNLEDQPRFGPSSR